MSIMMSYLEEKKREVKMTTSDMSMSSITCKSLDINVIKDLERNSEANSPHLEPLDIFKHGWKYRGEGNANVVLALQDDQRVIRLSKVNVEEPIGDLSKHRRKVEREVMFANRVFGPLIGSEFVGSVKAIQLSTDQITRLNGMLLNVRPAHRRHKEIRVPYATSHSDFARINRNPSDGVDFCVEIKPKQGWWPSCMKSADGNLPSLCTYCLNQFLKLKRAKISSRTSYCPLDLFSGNPQRMIEGVTALIANPQNNFRIFCDGKLVFGEYNDESLDAVLSKWMGCSESSSSVTGSEMPSALNSFIYLLCVSLLKPKYIPNKTLYHESIDIFNKITRQLRKNLSHVPPSQLYAKILSKSPQKLKENLSTTNADKQNLGGPCRDEASPLPEGCILHRILEIQKLADRHKNVYTGDSSIYQIYQKICPVHNPVATTKRNHLIRSHSPSSEENNYSDGSDYDMTLTPKLNVVLTGDSYDNFVDSGTETERLSDSESFEECDVSSTEEDEDETLIGTIEYEDNINPNSNKSNKDCCILTTSSSKPASVCPSSECLEKEKWLDEIKNLQLSEMETMATEMYLLAATAKDCSIMVTFAPVNNNKQDGSMEERSSSLPHLSLFSPNTDTDLLIEDLDNRTHRVRVGVADLDPKPVTTIVRHYLRDNEMLQAYATYCED